jgi:hypothetical protein
MDVKLYTFCAPELHGGDLYWLEIGLRGGVNVMSKKHVLHLPRIETWKL